MQLMFTMTIGEVKNFTSLDLMAGRVPHELPGGDPSDEFRTLRTAFRVSMWTCSTRTGSDCGRAPSDGIRPPRTAIRVGPVDGLHQDEFRLRRVELVRQAGGAGGAGLRRGLAAELERDSGIYPWF